MCLPSCKAAKSIKFRECELLKWRHLNDTRALDENITATVIVYRRRNLRIITYSVPTSHLDGPQKSGVIIMPTPGRIMFEAASDNSSTQVRGSSLVPWRRLETARVQCILYNELT